MPASHPLLRIFTTTSQSFPTDFLCVQSPTPQPQALSVSVFFSIISSFFCQNAYIRPMQTDTQLPARFIQELPDGTSFEMILVEGGEFMMGGSDEAAFDQENPIHPVRLSSYYLATFPIVQAIWKSVMNDNPSRFKGENHPVEKVSWDDTQTFVKRLKEKTGKSYRLPTEAEWEFAARGGTQTENYLYAGSDKLKEVGWYVENAGNGTRPVGMLLPNELGLHDMSGNVLEWCEDWYSGNYYQACLDRGLIENPSGPIEGSNRVLRGGRWSYGARSCRVSFRYSDGSDWRINGVGFRLALSPQSAGLRPVIP